LRLGGKRIAAAPRPAGATGGPGLVISTRATMVPMTAKAYHMKAPEIVWLFVVSLLLAVLVVLIPAWLG
jgi:hypothetical protein